MGAEAQTVKRLIPKFGWFWNQLVVGAMLDEGRFLPERYAVVLLGPLTLTWRLGRGKTFMLNR